MPIGKRLVVALIAACTAAGCGGSTSSTPASPTTPTTPTTPTPPGGSAVSGQVVDGLTAAALSGVVVKMDGSPEVTTTSTGAFILTVDGSDGTPRTLALSSQAIVSRTTRLRVPGPEATLSLIPASFDVPSFDEMFRSSGGLRRWTTAPRLVVQSRLLTFTNVSDADYATASSTMSAAEAAGMIADLEWALPQLTGGAFTAFADEQQETAAEGQRVAVSRPGYIVVNRVQGLTAALGFWGYTRWAWNANGEVQSGFMMIDTTFDASGSPFRRSLRAHEFGHALGYTHVTSRVSLMNSNARSEPTAFDKDAAKIAFQRPPLNRTPDIDPDPFTGNLRALRQLVWAGDR